ncbi:MAG: alanine:cation symporter family protein [Fusobacteriales bacterium]|jgi:AGCS family alanine or glycine:cation symporter|nr:alanine:cation symporter family protein [Fusobacteriales bacterium]
MENVFKVINDFFEFIVPISDFLWDFPTNVEIYSNIPILGKFSFALILLVGTGIFFSIKTKFVQVTKFKEGLKILIKKKTSDIGVSPLASFLLSSATRVGPGNIMGVTGAISVGGPGAVFWMWVSAFFGMATAFAESVLAQVFKEQDENNYIGGLPFYGKKILGNKRTAGILLSVCFILYALFTLPGQTFHLFTALGSVAEVIGGVKYERTSSVYYIIAAVIFFSVLFTTIDQL